MSILSSVNYIEDGEKFEAVVANRPHRDLYARDEELYTLISASTGSVNYPGFYGDIYTYSSGGTSIVIGQGTTAADDVDGILMTASGDLTINGSNVGVANGLDTGSLSTGWYYIWLIRGPVSGTEAGLISTSTSSPTLPSGYTIKRLIGAAYYSGGFEAYIQDQLEVFYSERRAVYSSGSVKSSYQNTNVSNYIPTSISRIGYFDAYITGERVRMEVQANSDGGSGGCRVVAVGTYDGVGYDASQFKMALYNTDYLRWRHVNSGYINSFSWRVDGFKIHI